MSTLVDVLRKIEQLPADMQTEACCTVLLGEIALQLGRIASALESMTSAEHNTKRTGNTESAARNEAKA